MMVPAASDKPEVRRAAMARRKTAHETAAPDAGAALAARFMALGLVRPGVILSAYLPIRTEIDVRPLMRAAEAAGARICLPVILGPARPLVFREWRVGAPLVEIAFKTLAPAEGAELEPDVLATPLLAFDRGGWRLGYGGGFYDRTLERLRGLKPVSAWGMAYAAQEMEAVPREPTDARLDGILTERETIRIIESRESGA